GRARSCRCSLRRAACAGQASSSRRTTCRRTRGSKAPVSRSPSRRSPRPSCRDWRRSKASSCRRCWTCRARIRPANRPSRCWSRCPSRANSSQPLRRGARERGPEPAGPAARGPKPPVAPGCWTSCRDRDPRPGRVPRRSTGRGAKGSSGGCWSWGVTAQAPEGVDSGQQPACRGSAWRQGAAGGVAVGGREDSVHWRGQRAPAQGSSGSTSTKEAGSLRSWRK
ncbi:MAG: hypothetical protein RIR65_979, partial [Planctomycetota bacterium]